MPDPERAIEEAEADRCILEHAVEQGLAGAVLATALDRHIAEARTGQDEPHDRSGAQDVVSRAEIRYGLKPIVGELLLARATSTRTLSIAAFPLPDCIRAAAAAGPWVR